MRFTLSAQPLFVGMCWCRDCQRIASGSAVVAAQFPASALTLDGRTASHEKQADSGNPIERVFCPECGTQLFGRTPGAVDPIVRIRVGALDDPARFAPRAIIWTDSAPPWAVLDPALPCFPKMPPSRPKPAS